MTNEQLSMYPDFPGYKEHTTSKQAAIEVAGRAGTLRKLCLNCLKERPFTADEIAGILGESVLSIRPRISELRTKGLIEKTKERRLNASGKQAIVWRIKQ